MSKLSAKAVEMEDTEENNGPVSQAIANSSSELASFLSDPETFKMLNDAGSDMVELKDPKIELDREIVKMGLAVGEYIDMLPQVTNLDHPQHAKGLAHDMTELEIMRMLGLPEHIYNTVHGREKALSGFFGHLKARMGIVYPGIAVDLHPRGQLFGSLTKDKTRKEDSLMQRLAAKFQ